MTWTIRCLSGAVASLVVVFGASVPSLADGHPETEEECQAAGGVWTDGDGSGRETQISGCFLPEVPEPGESEPPTNVPSPGEPDPCEVEVCYTVVHLHPSTTPDGSPCYYSEVVDHVGELPFGAIPLPDGTYVINEMSSNWYDDHARAGDTPQPCPPASPEPPAPTPDDVADLLPDVVTQHLPAPRLEVDPGEIVTGLPAYLESQWDDAPPPLDPDCLEHAGAPDHRYDHDRADGACEELPDDVRLHLAGMQLDVHGVPLEVTLDAVARYVVDWGDGAAPAEFTIEGFPYPDGTVRHTYQSVPPEGEVTITIQEYWTVEWTVDSLGTFPLDGEMAPPPTEVTVPVTEIQAVVQ